MVSSSTPTASETHTSERIMYPEARRAAEFARPRESPICSTAVELTGRPNAIAPTSRMAHPPLTHCGDVRRSTGSSNPTGTHCSTSISVLVKSRRRSDRRGPISIYLGVAVESWESDGPGDGVSLNRPARPARASATSSAKSAFPS